MLYLVHLALTWRFVRTVADDFCPVAKPFAGEMIVGHLDDDLRIDRFPFTRPLRAPTTRTPRCVASESRRLPERFEFFGQRRTLARLESGSKSDAMEQTIVIVQSEEQRSQNAGAARIAKSADDAIGGAELFHLHHRRPFPGGGRRPEP